MKKPTPTQPSEDCPDCKERLDCASHHITCVKNKWEEAHPTKGSSAVVDEGMEDDNDATLGLIVGIRNTSPFTYEAQDLLKESLQSRDAQRDKARDEELVEGLAKWIWDYNRRIVASMEFDKKVKTFIPEWEQTSLACKDSFREEARAALKAAREKKEGDK